MSQVEVDKIIPQSGTTLTIGDSGDTITIASGATLSGSLNADNLDSGTVPTARISGAYTGITQTGTLTSFASTGIDDNATSTAITINSSNNVGIGVTPSSGAKLDIYGGGIVVDTTGSSLFGTRYTSGTGASAILLYKSQSDTIGTHTALSNGSGIGSILTRGSDGTSFIPGTLITSEVDGSVSLNSLPTRITFSTNSGSNSYSERMRIDSSGNLLVGKTSTDFGTEGVTLFNSNDSGGTRTHVTADNQTATHFNRLNSDGDISRFYKNTAQVGSIGTSSGALTIYPTVTIGTGLYMDANHIEPTQNNGTRTDNTRDFGSSSYRWKDLYLGGGLYVGGTAGANKLDDYEEGTWTPTFVNQNGTEASNYVNNSSGQYIKIGKMVYVNVSWNMGTITTGPGSLYAGIGGFPFVADGDAGGSPWYTNIDVPNGPITFQISNNFSHGIFYSQRDDLTYNTISPGAISSNDNLQLTFCYKTD